MSDNIKYTLLVTAVCLASVAVAAVVCWIFNDFDPLLRFGQVVAAAYCFFIGYVAALKLLD